MTHVNEKTYFVCLIMVKLVCISLKHELLDTAGLFCFAQGSSLKRMRVLAPLVSSLTIFGMQRAVVISRH